jgi:hypothetical protein
MNYGELQAQFEGLLKRRDMTPTQSSTFLQQAVSRVQRVLRIPPMEKSVSVIYDGTIFTNGELPIPSDYLRLIAMTATDPDGSEREVKKKDLQSVLYARAGGASGCPTAFARRGSVWAFGPIPAAGTSFRIDYYDEFGALSTPSDSNYLTEAAADLIIYGALSYAGDWFVDKRAPAWEARFQAIKGEIEDQAAQDELVNAVASSAYEIPEF